MKKVLGVETWEEDSLDHHLHEELHRNTAERLTHPGQKVQEYPHSRDSRVKLAAAQEEEVNAGSIDDLSHYDCLHTQFHQLLELRRHA